MNNDFNFNVESFAIGFMVGWIIFAGMLLYHALFE
jgi:hypothetical protein